MVGYILETWIRGMEYLAKSFKYRTTKCRDWTFSAWIITIHQLICFFRGVIQSVHRKFLRVPKSHDYSGYNRNNLATVKSFDVRWKPPF